MNMALPHPLPPFVPGQKVTAADHMNPLRLNAENLDERVGDVTTSNPAGARLSALEATTGDPGSGNDALDGRLATVEQRTTDDASGNAALDTRVASLNGRLDDVETRTTDTATGNAALGERVASVDTRLTTVETRTTDADSGNDALGSRVSALEATPPGSAITYSGFVNLDPNVVGFKPASIASYEVYRSTAPSGGTGPTYLEFPNPHATVTVYGSVQAHMFATNTARGGMKVEISLDGGATWHAPVTSPLAGTPGTSAASTCYVGAQYSMTGEPTGTVRVRATAMREQAIVDGFFRATLYASMLGGAGARTG